MRCWECGHESPKNLWVCGECGAGIEGGVVFVTGISGSDSEAVLARVIAAARRAGHEHDVLLHDVGEIMRGFAEEHDPHVVWDRILDTSPRILRLLRALAFQKIEHQFEANRDALHIVDLHLCFRWTACLSKGFEPSIVLGFAPHVRLFINVIGDLDEIQQRLEQTAWGEREILELLIWRDEEKLLTDVYAGICGAPWYLVAAAEPPETIERLVWHPSYKRVYLSYPMTAIKDDARTDDEIKAFRDTIRDFLVVFDPGACQDYDKTYERPELLAVRKQVGDTTVERDFRLIDQADAVVVYYPRKVTSKGVDAEMRHAFETGTPVFLYCPELLDYGPFQPPADRIRQDAAEYVDLLREQLAPQEGEGDDV